jgi:predicted AAA+ superfamily ATPase
MVSVKRTFWLARIDQARKQHNVVWLSGVRRAGKTTLAKDVAGARHFDCELPRVRIDLEDPELFLRRAGSGVIVLDEIHRLPHPSEVLKIAADHFPRLTVLATGSSTLAARTKFRDSLTGRKAEVWLTPMIWQDVVDFAIDHTTADRRMLHGGLPPFYLGDAPDDAAFAEWIDSYWAKDLQELFVIDKKAALFKLVELLFRQSGGMFEAQSFTAPCEISRQTVQHYLEVLETTLLATVLRPYSAGAAGELVHQPRVYMFDTGFVAYFRGWDALRSEDRGYLLEHLVLSELQARFLRSAIFYWRDKQKHEVDFVLKPGRGAAVVAIECKESASSFDPAGMAAFRRRHARGTNVLVCLDAREPTARTIGGLEVEVVPYAALGGLLDALR